MVSSKLGTYHISVLFRQDGADIQQSTDEGKTWQSYSPIEETDYFTYDEFSAWIENETENIQKLVDAGEWTEAEATEALEYYDEILSIPDTLFFLPAFPFSDYCLKHRKAQFVEYQPEES